MSAIRRLKGTVALASVEGLKVSVRYHHDRFRSVLPEGALLAAVLVGAWIWGSLLWDVREQTRGSAERVGTKFVEAVAGDVQHNLESVRLSVQRTATIATTPGIWAVPAGIRNAALFGAFDSVRRASATLVIDKDGQLLSMSGDQPPSITRFGSQDYFEFHRTHSDLNPLITAKAVGNSHAEKLLIVSQRMNDSLGNFAGVVAEGLSTSSFPELFRELHIDQGEASALIDIDGTVIGSLPSDARVSGTTQASLIKHVTQAASGTYIDAGETSGRQRLIAYQKLDGQPLIVVYSQVTNTLFAAWLKLAICTGLLLVALRTLKARLIPKLRKDRSHQTSAEQHARLSTYALETANENLERQISKEIHARQDALRQLARGQRLEALGQLSGGIAHDINNVLQTISGACSLMQNRSKANPEMNRLASVALSAAHRGSAVTRRLLVFARHAITNADDVEATPILQDLQLLLNQTLCGSVVVELDLDDKLPSFQVDRMQFETVIINLATNARDAMPNGGTITIAARVETVAADSGESAHLRPGRYIRLSVADTGTGMDEETLARATEPFFSTKEVDKGTGLGLSMAKTFSEQSKGKCEISSSVGSGTTVMLWFPAAEEKQVDFKLPERGSLNRTFRLNDVRVLVVDDNDQSRELISESLGDAGFKVFQAGSGAEALSVIRGGLEIDLLLTDLSMPRMNGIQLIGALRDIIPRLPAIVLTGNTDAVANLAIEDEVGGSCLVLVKPVHLNELLNHIGSVLLEGASPDVAALELGSALLVD
jgi:signal transduction histidine kinase/ActR/RegA family two-component response regulator